MIKIKGELKMAILSRIVAIFNMDRNFGTWDRSDSRNANMKLNIKIFLITMQLTTNYCFQNLKNRSSNEKMIQSTVLEIMTKI